MLDPQKIKQFWDARSQHYQSLPFESVVNLEQDPKNLDIKIREETQKVLNWLPDLRGKTVLDLGAGVGQWAFRFQQRGAARIVAVEFSQALVDIGRKEAERRQASNVQFITSPAESFCSSESFDILFISGLFIYLNDDQAEQLVANLAALAGDNTTLLLRDGTGILGRHEINNQFSEHLQTDYSATYRTAEAYRALFASHGFELKKEENMFPEGHVLNKYPETRLRLYLFGKA